MKVNNIEVGMSVYIVYKGAWQRPDDAVVQKLQIKKDVIRRIEQCIDSYSNGTLTALYTKEFSAININSVFFSLSDAKAELRIRISNEILGLKHKLEGKQKEYIEALEIQERDISGSEFKKGHS